MIETYYTIPGTVTSEGVVAVIPIDHLPKLLENDQVMIDRAHYKYRVLQILDDVIVDKDRLYRQVLIDVLLPLHLQVENNTFSMQIPLEKKFILKIIESCWKEE